VAARAHHRPSHKPHTAKISASPQPWYDDKRGLSFPALCDKCQVQMRIRQAVLTMLPLVFVWACSGGGGSSSTASSPWEKFRHDTINSGAAGGSIASNNLKQQSVPVDMPTPPATPAAISSSPAIAEDGTVYIGSEGGTLAAFDANLNVKWRKTFCEACPADSQALGPLISSPAIYTLNGQTSIFIGSSTGSVFAFQDNGTGQPTCSACSRWPFGAAPSPGPTPVVQFLSSPSFSTDPVVLTVNGVFIGARIEMSDGRIIGKLYSFNSDGSVRWQFPRRGQSDIGPVTSSPALEGNTGWYFTAADGYLYSLAFDGSLRWKSSIGPTLGPTFGPTPPFAPAVLVAESYIVSPTADGNVFAITPDQFVSFRVAGGDSGIGPSLAFGNRGQETPSPTPVATATAQPGFTATETATPTPGIPSFIYGVMQSGQIVAFNPALPTPTVFPTPSVSVAAPVISSPALSADGFLVFGDLEGQLHAVSTGYGSELAGFPIQLSTTAIRSSPSIAGNGTIYVGADDGMLHAVGLP
jgi:outer membrane protein assembly factor BamB